MRRLPILIGAVVVLVILGLSSIFVVDERKQALVLQFGQVKQVRTEPGLYFKLPLIQDVVYYEGRILPLDTDPLEVTPLDQRRLVVDAFARWRITDPVEFRQAVGSEMAGMQRLESILNASLREVLGSVPSTDVLSPERSVLMTRIRDAARESSRGLGVEIIDVRIRRADLPEQNLNATFERMEAERQREAADERARGKERAQEIRATADRQAVELVSDAERQATIIRGQADAERNRVYAEAFGRDHEFFAFYRSLQAYQTALTGENSTLVISPDSEFFEYLKSPLPSPDGNGAEAPTPVAAATPGTGPETGAETETAEPSPQAASDEATGGEPAPEDAAPAGANLVTPAEAAARAAEISDEADPANLGDATGGTEAAEGEPAGDGSAEAGTDAADTPDQAESEQGSGAEQDSGTAEAEAQPDETGPDETAN